MSFVTFMLKCPTLVTTWGVLPSHTTNKASKKMNNTSIPAPKGATAGNLVKYNRSTVYTDINITMRAPSMYIPILYSILIGYHLGVFFFFFFFFFFSYAFLIFNRDLNLFIIVVCGSTPSSICNSSGERRLLAHFQYPAIILIITEITTEKISIIGKPPTWFRRSSMSV